MLFGKFLFSICHILGCSYHTLLFMIAPFALEPNDIFHKSPPLLVRYFNTLSLSIWIKKFGSMFLAQPFFKKKKKFPSIYHPFLWGIWCQTSSYRHHHQALGHKKGLISSSFQQISAKSQLHDLITCYGFYKLLVGINIIIMIHKLFNYKYNHRFGTI